MIERKDNSSHHGAPSAAETAETMEDRLADSLELSDLVGEIFTAGLRAEFPDASDEEIDRIARERLTRNLPRRPAP